MHLSLYRKFRPDRFDKIVRQEHVVRVLVNQIMSGAVGHAYLFCGPRGTGKTSIARILARAVNCENPQNGSPCGECPACRALKEESLDITEIDAASNNGVGEMRDLREKVQYPPVAGRYKVYIIDEVHMLTDSAFNALLKTLEEPPAHAIFILATTEPHKLPATILSRCMRLDFKLIPEEDLQNHLISILEDIGKPYEKEAVAAIARAGAGSDRDMLSIAEMCISYGDKLTYDGVIQVLGAADFTQTVSLCEALVKSDLSAVLEQTESLFAEGKAAGVLLRDLIEMLNKIIIAKTCRTAERLLCLPKEQFTRIMQVAKDAEGCALTRAAQILSKTETELRFSSSPRVCLETALIKIASPESDLSTEALLVRIAKLEKRAESVPQTTAPTVVPQSAPTPLSSAREIPPQEESYDFPTEEPVFEEAYFAEEPTIPKPVQPKIVSKPEPPAQRVIPEPMRPVPKAAEPVQPKPPVQPQAQPLPASERNAELIFGKLMRMLRKAGNSGVLFTMCMDLEAKFEGEKLVLFTASDIIFKSLSKPEHRATMGDILNQLGVSEFEVRSKTGSQSGGGKQAIDELKENFKDYPIEFRD